MSAVQRGLAARYASPAADGPIDEEFGDNPRALLDALERLGLLDASEKAVWHDRIERFSHDPASRPRLPDELRRAARAYLATRRADPLGGARRALEAVGALSWRDTDEAPVPKGIVVERVYPVPPRAVGGVTIASIVRYADAIEVCWYAGVVALGDVLPPAPVELASPLGLGLADDRGERYLTSGSSHARGQGPTAVGSSLFWPAPARDARWVEVVRNDTPLVRVPLD